MMKKDDQTVSNETIIGATSTGMPIHADADHPAHEAFSTQDHLDAAMVHQDRANILLDQGDMDAFLSHDVEAGKHNEYARGGRKVFAGYHPWPSRMKRYEWVPTEHPHASVD